MIGKSLRPCYKFIAVLPVLLSGINSYKVFTNQFFELGLNLERGFADKKFRGPSFGQGSATDGLTRENFRERRAHYRSLHYASLRSG